MPNATFFESDKAIYLALYRREDRAYNYLYAELLGPFSYWVLKNSGSQTDAEDAFQKGLMNFLLNLETGKYQYQEGTKVTTVIFDYCKKVWLTELQSARIRTGTALPKYFDPAADDDIQKDLERSELINAVRKALSQLKDDCQKMITWFYIEELSLREIAEKMGMMESSTKAKRYDCTEKLKGFYLNQAKRL